MNQYRNKNEGRYDLSYTPDRWEPYRGMYPDPTHLEFRLIDRFLHKLAVEDEDFVEEGERWMLFKEHHPYTNLRSLLLKFLQQVRQSKGYDVDLYFDFSVVPGWDHYHSFLPHSLDDKNSYDTAMAASKFATREINTLMRGKRNYILVSVEKLVTITTNYNIFSLTVTATGTVLLLTFTAKEIFTERVETLQAMLFHDANTDPSTFQLKDWKFKPVPI